MPWPFIPVNPDCVDWPYLPVNPRCLTSTTTTTTVGNIGGIFTNEFNNIFN